MKARLFQECETMPRRSLLFLCIAMALAVAPLVAKVPLWACALLLAAAFGRLLAERWLGGRWLWMLGVALFGAGVSAALFQYNTIVGLEPGTVVMLVLLSLKFLEAKTTRDFRVLVLLGYFVCLTTLFFSQDFIVCLYIGGVFAVLTAALVHLQLVGWGEAQRKLWPATRLSLILLAQATPVIVLLFLFFPRLGGLSAFQLNSPLLDKTGMSDDMSPGSIAGVVTSTKVAFRADFPEGKVPQPASMYWRGVVLWDEDGLHWMRGAVPSFGRREPLSGEIIRQRITLEPHGQKWLFALDRPASIVKGAIYTSGGALESRQPVISTLRYEVGSQPENRETTLNRLEKRAALETRGVSPRVQELAASWRRAAKSDRDVIDLALRYFSKERFVYSLTPGGYGQKDSLDEFLFHRRAGFCEHYAASFATLMRLANIPARVVLGYLGGNKGYGGYVIVPESDAHAWAEVWLPDQGWLRVDPTVVVAPERVNAGLESFLEAAASASVQDGRAGGSVGFLGLRDIVRQIQLLWDSVNYQWDLKVMGFDDETQRNFLNVSGLGNPGTMRLLLRTFMGIGILLTIAGSWMQFHSRAPRDKVSSIYEGFCRRTAAAGLRRERWEGPLDFRQRALARFPGQAEEIGNIFLLYIRLRYGADGQNRQLVKHFADAVKLFRRQQ